MDITASVAFALSNNLRFCFRSCSSRNPDLTSWSEQDFDYLFDESPFINFEGYLPFQEIKITGESIWNGDGKCCVEYGLSCSELVDISHQHSFVVVKQAWPIIDWQANAKLISMIPYPLPSENVLQKYRNAVPSLPGKYNFLAYRYEHDFVNYFSKAFPGTRFPMLHDILSANLFVDLELPIYLACSRPTELSAPHLKAPIDSFLNLVFVDESLFVETNFEIGAYVDFLIGLESQEVLAHSRSAFGRTLNSMHKTSNYYDELLFSSQ
jgi:hypothetical protein